MFRVPSNAGVHYSLNHEKRLVTNYLEVGYLFKAVALGTAGMV